ncbi:MAG: hypothetical protein JRJ47_12195 [Deltaproteobacteria bacterium]|nr:hypothetical protein [Deltaproteobacteria bacterium]
MAGLRKMQWNDKVWNSLRNAITPMPLFVRKKALLKIIEASEKNAANRDSQLVEAKDLIKATKEKVPEKVQRICLESLAEQGIVDEEQP